MKLQNIAPARTPNATFIARSAGLRAHVSMTGRQTVAADAIVRRTVTNGGYAESESGSIFRIARTSGSSPTLRIPADEPGCNTAASPSVRLGFRAELLP